MAVLADKTLLTIDLQLFAQDEGEERQEPATQKRRQEARRRGEVFQSREMSAALLLLAAMGVFAAAGPWTARAINDIFQVSYGQWLAGDWGMGDLGSWSAAVTKALLVAVGPMMLVLVVLALGLGLVQTGFLWTTVPLAPKLERINPAAGAKRIFSRRALFELLKSLLRVLVVGGVAYSGARRAMERTFHAAGGQLGSQVVVIGREVMTVLWYGAAAYAVLALLDVIYQRWQHERRLMMTRQELKRELREAEGDPQLRARVRARQRELTRNRILQEVARADVVITNPTHVAVALSYDPATMAAPHVVAKGRDYMALIMKDHARRHGVVWVQEPLLARRLYKDVEVGEPVPEALYGAVAEVIAFVWRLTGRSWPGDDIS